MRKEELRKGLQKGGSLQNTGLEDPSEGPLKEGPGPFHEIRGGPEESLPDETTRRLPASLVGGRLQWERKQKEQSEMNA